MGDMKGQVALVTGGTRGIGLAICQRLIDRGVTVAAGYAGRHDHAREFADKYADRGVSIHQGNIGHNEDCVRVIGEVLETHGHLDILVNNAGITHAAEFLDLEEKDFDRVLAVNLKSMFLMSQAVARIMVEQTWPEKSGGAIVNMSSVNAVLAIPNQVPYVISKGGVNQLTKGSAIALAPHRIRVNAIGPGTILTEMARAAVLTNDEARRKILSRSPLGRCGEPEEVAAVAAFLASDDASYLTGQTIYPDGGRLALNYTVPVAG